MGDLIIESEYLSAHDPLMGQSDDSIRVYAALRFKTVTTSLSHTGNGATKSIEIRLSR
jgi:hypothetical protein